MLHPLHPVSFALAVAVTGCAANEASEFDDESDMVDTTSVNEAELSAGVNGSACAASPYNCKFRKEGGPRVTTASGDEQWEILPGAFIVDGNGHALGSQGGSRLTFNYGQTRLLAGRAHALALSTSNNSAGWFPIDHIKNEQSFRARMGEVNGKDPGQRKMACYEIRNSHDASIELKKVVYDSQVGDDGHERAGDYLPLARKNGKRSANLLFSVPGFALGGATTDHFPAGTKFQRVDVPTTKGPPSITIPLWVKDSQGKFKKKSGSLQFIYGYVKASDGVRRFGWMALEALAVSSGCK